jgi:NADPH:quinone reductase-like Zn-dependent oxidoreductase
MAPQMKAAQIKAFGGPEQLQVQTIDRPSPGPGQVLVKVTFASVNAMDWKLVAGLMKDWVKALPWTPGGDFSGTVEAMGPGAEGKLALGSAVFGRGSGCYAEYAVADLAGITAKPAGVSFEDAAALPIAGVTAWQAIHTDGSVRPGQRVLIQGGSGGVGHFAVQIAKRAGATVITTASADNAKWVATLGADEVLDYRLPVAKQTQGIDLVVDGIGPDSQSQAYSVLKPGGLLISLIGPPPAAPSGVRAIATRANVNSESLLAVAAMVERGDIKVAIQKVFPLAQAGEAQTFSHGPGRRGKVLIRL